VEPAGVVTEKKDASIKAWEQNERSKVENIAQKKLTVIKACLVGNRGVGVDGVGGVMCFIIAVGVCGSVVVVFGSVCSVVGCEGKTGMVFGSATMGVVEGMDDGCDENVTFLCCRISNKDCWNASWCKLIRNVTGNIGSAT
nr:hypothetical protein [Tanacetum cinerariifolium]